MSAESTIITAIHNIKGNHGSETPGVDSKTMRKDYLQKPFPWVVADIQRAFKHFEPQQIRRVYIDKPGKSEKRPLGIPAIRDRIVQECMRIVLEPILEAQFFAHSYGFRPMRDAAMALERVDIIMHNTGNYWIVEGDISKCFDRIDHSILIKRLYHMGIKDRRVLQIIKAMLKAGVMEECAVNEEGTPQGGLISPLLANVYLDIMDEWVSKQWENKRTRHQYVQTRAGTRSCARKPLLFPDTLSDTRMTSSLQQTPEHMRKTESSLAILSSGKNEIDIIPRKNTDNRHQKEVHQILRLRVQNGSGEIPQRLHPKNDSRP